MPEKEKNKQPPLFKGRELVLAARGVQRDLLSTLLDPEKLYTKEQVSALVDTHKKREVKQYGGR